MMGQSPLTSSLLGVTARWVMVGELKQLILAIPQGQSLI